MTLIITQQGHSSYHIIRHTGTVMHPTLHRPLKEHPCFVQVETRHPTDPENAVPPCEQDRSFTHRRVFCPWYRTRDGGDPISGWVFSGSLPLQFQISRLKLYCVRAVLVKFPLQGIQPSTICINTQDFMMMDVSVGNNVHNLSPLNSKCQHIFVVKAGT